MKAPRVGLFLAVAGAALVSGCEDECCFVDVTSHAVVRGVIESAPGVPAPQARLEPFGVLKYQCHEVTNPVWTPGDSAALANTDGTVMLVIYTADGPGNHCVDFVAADETGVQKDTIRDLQLEFRLLEEVPDTAEVAVALGS